MKTLNKEELKAVASDIFSRYPKAEKVAVTSDGMAFITDESELAVKNHAMRNVSGKELAIEHFRRSEMSGQNPVYANVGEAIAAIEACTTVEELEAIHAIVVAGKNWKTAIAAIDEKKESLKLQ